MKPIAIFRHAPTEGPGYFAEYLNQHALPWQLICIDAGEAVPGDASQYAGLVFMGGPMSVNDDLPWITDVLSLIRDAVARDIPVLGHCLGGQLMCKALGGVVSRNPVKEIGWGEVSLAANAAARTWFGDAASFSAFHWHGETFSPPEGATHLLSSQYCVNQAWAMGKHLALQCHIEMTEQMIRDWCTVGADEIAAASTSPGVQQAARMQAEMAQRLPALHQLAAHVYGHWLQGLSRP
jgi:GMP synthase-like glutamine amidotransferase